VSHFPIGKTNTVILLINFNIWKNNSMPLIMFNSHCAAISEAAPLNSPSLPNFTYRNMKENRHNKVGDSLIWKMNKMITSIVVIPTVSSVTFMKATIIIKIENRHNRAAEFLVISISLVWAAAQRRRPKLHKDVYWSCWILSITDLNVLRGRNEWVN